MPDFMPKPESFVMNTLADIQAFTATPSDAIDDSELPYYRRLLDGITEDGNGCWLWHGRMRGASPTMTWPGHTWDAMVRRKLWQLATGDDPGALQLARRCTERRCVRPHPAHIVLTMTPKGGGGARRAAPPQTRTNPNDIAKLVDSIRSSADELRKRGVSVSLQIG